MKPAIIEVLVTDSTGRSKVQVELPDGRIVIGVWSPGYWVDGNLGMLPVDNADGADEAEKALREWDRRNKPYENRVRSKR